MTRYQYYVLPKIKRYDNNDTIVTTIGGDFNNQFMLFDKSMNKFIFNGITKHSVGTYKVLVSLQSQKYKELKATFQFNVIVKDVTVNIVDPVSNVANIIWSMDVTYNVPT